MAVDVFLKLDGIDGESTDSKHSKEIEVQSFSWGVSQPASATASSAGGAPSERATFQDFSITKFLDSASPKLMEYCATGAPIKEATLSLNRAGGDKTQYMEYKMSNVIVSGVSTGGSKDGDVPTESISFNYGKIVLTYEPQTRGTGKAAGKVIGGWDLEKNEKAS